MRKQLFSIILIIFTTLLMSSCAILDDVTNIIEEDNSHNVTLINELKYVDNFRNGALEHILEGELNRNGQAVGFHYNQLPTKKGEIVSGTETEPNEFGVYEAKVIVSNVEKTSNRGMSTFFPNEWDTQHVVDVINEAYDNRVYINGNTFEGLTDGGIVIRMYLDNEEKIISAFPIY